MRGFDFNCWQTPSNVYSVLSCDECRNAFFYALNYVWMHASVSTLLDCLSCVQDVCIFRFFAIRHSVTLCYVRAGLERSAFNNQAQERRRDKSKKPTLLSGLWITGLRTVDSTGMDLEREGEKRGGAWEHGGEWQEREESNCLGWKRAKIKSVTWTEGWQVTASPVNE